MHFWQFSIVLNPLDILIYYRVKQFTLFLVKNIRLRFSREPLVVFVYIALYLVQIQPIFFWAVVGLIRILLFKLTLLVVFARVIVLLRVAYFAASLWTLVFIVADVIVVFGLTFIFGFRNVLRPLVQYIICVVFSYGQCVVSGASYFCRLCTSRLTESKSAWALGRALIV